MFFSPQVIKRLIYFAIFAPQIIKNCMISIDGLAVEFSGTTLFSDISFVINEKDRIALMGKTEREKYLTQDSGRSPTAYPWQGFGPQGLRSSLSPAAFDDGRRQNRVCRNGTGFRASA